jgi:hypothetical protein
MATRKIPAPGGGTVDAEVIDIEDIHDRPITITLSDGAVLRMRVDVIEVCRTDKFSDQDGNPFYSVRSGNLLSVVEPPRRQRSRKK